MPANLDNTLHQRFNALDPTEQALFNRVMTSLAPAFINVQANQENIIGALEALNPQQLQAFVTEINGFGNTPTAAQLSTAVGRLNLSAPQGNVLKILAEHHRDILAAPAAGPEQAPAQLSDTDRQTIATEAGRLRGVTGPGSALQRAFFFMRLAFNGVDITNQEEILSGNPAAIRPCEQQAKFVNIIVALVGVVSALKNPTQSAGEGGTEQANRTPEQQAEAITDMALNTMVSARLDTANGQNNLVISPKAAGNTITPPSLLESLSAMEGAQLDAATGRITIPYATTAKIEQVRTAVQSAIVESIDDFPDTPTLNANAKQGIKNAIAQPGQWVEGGQPNWVYVFAHNRIVAQKTVAPHGTVELDSARRDWGPNQTTTYFDTSTGEFKNRDGMKYNTASKEWEAMSEPEQKEEADKQKLEAGITFITGQKGMVGVNNVKTRPGNSYFIDLGWDVDDIVVRFNQDGKKWEIKEQDEEVFHPAGDGNLPDEWSGNGLEAVKRIDAGLKKINDGQEA